MEKAKGVGDPGETDFSARCMGLRREGKGPLE